jgi:DNA-binding GntR family transcriptional regulator
MRNLWLTATMGTDSRSKTDDVQRQLRADILNGRLAPGSKLAFAELRNRYQCSTGVIREALPRLVGEGLVTSEPQLGFRVVAVSTDDLRQLTESRVIIETMVLRRSIEEGDVAWEARIMGAHHVLARLPMLAGDGTVSLDWTAAHADFHAALLEACSNARLRNMANLLRDCAEVYRCWSHSSYQPHERDIPAEHRRILEAALNRDADAAAAALTGHIELTTEILLRSQRTGAATGGVGQDAAETALRLMSWQVVGKAPRYHAMMLMWIAPVPSWRLIRQARYRSMSRSRRRSGARLPTARFYRANGSPRPETWRRSLASTPTRCSGDCARCETRG